MFGNEIVSYMYGEMDASAKGIFEAHLSTCDECVSEFAFVSESRLGVFEWHRDEFQPLPTPSFVIPYRTPTASIPEPRYSWLDALRDLVASPVRVAAAGVAVAILAIASFEIYFAPTGADDTFVADNIQDVRVADVEPPSVSPTIDNVASERVVTDSKFEKNGVVGERTYDRVTKAKRIASPVQVRNTRQEPLRERATQATRTQNAPRLGNFSEVEDTSLRLADLVADIDTY